MSELGFFTFTGHGFTFDEAVEQSTLRVQEWLKTHQLRGYNHERLYDFHHATLVEERPQDQRLYRHVISVYGPAGETT